jgi:hypothetical protein
MTPEELSLYAESHIERERERYKLAIQQAYLTAGISRMKNPPSLSSLLRHLDNGKEIEPMTPEEILTTLKKGLGG